jgi:hypothetical protein
MKVVIIANDQQWEEWPLKEPSFVRVVDRSALNDHSADLFINLTDTLNESLAGSNAVNMIRINAWPGFLQRNVWEVAGNITADVKGLFGKIGKKIIAVPDEPGFISGRVIAMIINEAYFAIAGKVSTKSGIDIAMKLGTNYPLGPFEWAEKVGLRNVYELLNSLSKTDKRYTPAPSMIAELNAL